MNFLYLFVFIPISTFFRTKQIGRIGIYIQNDSDSGKPNYRFLRYFCVHSSNHEF